MPKSIFNSKTPTGEDQCRPCACCLSLCEFTCIATVDLERLASLVSSITADSYTLSTSSSMMPPDLWGKGTDGGNTSGTLLFCFSEVVVSFQDSFSSPGFLLPYEAENFPFKIYE